MKCRLSHVTNSSSSSFIIARNNKCTSEEVINLIIEKLSDDIKKYLQEAIMFEDINDFNCNIKDAIIQDAIIQKDYDKAVKLIAEELCNILESRYEIELDDWKVHAQQFSNDYDFYDALIYEYGYKLISDNFKVG